MFFPRKEIYDNPQSLTVIFTDITLYCVNNSELIDTVGRWDRSRRGGKRPKGINPGARLNTVQYLWADTIQSHDRRYDVFKQKIQPFELQDIEALYVSIVQRLSHQTTVMSFTAGYFRELIPRPQASIDGLQLGSR